MGSCERVLGKWSSCSLEGNALAEALLQMQLDHNMATT